jgi:ribonucleotide reductase beta subunit family protein with ferritin-like domain
MSTPETRTAPAAAAISYDDLYARWEQGNWSATEIDFTEDARQWREELTDHERKAALWNYNLFFYGEDAVADNLGPYIDAAPLEEQKYFLTTQQVDEARHAVFFKRFMHEVAGVGDGTMRGGLEQIKPELTWGFRQVFDRLDTMADELRKDRSKVQLAKAVTLYHLVVEASMAQAGQHMIEDSLTQYDVLPGFRDGMRNVSLDEQRHIGFGVKLLSDLYREDPETIQDAIISTIREVLPWTAGVAAPPNWDRSYTECFGFTVEDLGEAGARSLDQKLRAVGLPLDDGVPGLPWRNELEPRERAERGMRLLKANYIGPGGPLDRDPDVAAIYFDQVATQADTRHVPAGTTIQWDFTDYDPWYITLANGSSAATQGRASKPDLTFRVGLDDWVSVGSGRVDPWRLVMQRRLRPRGKLRLLPKLPRVFD